MKKLNKKMKIVSILSLLFFQSCFVYNEKEPLSLSTVIKQKEHLDSSLTSVNISNSRLTIMGSGFAKATIIKIQGGGADINLNIDTVSDSQIIASASNAFSFLIGGTFNLIIGTVDAQVIYPITFILQDGAVQSAHLASMGASSGQVLKFNGTNWVPSALANSQIYLGVWNANTNNPDIGNAGSFQSGDYFIVNVAGIYSGISYAVGDWAMFNGTGWDKIDNTSNTVTSFQGRKGVVVLQPSDYVTLKDLTTHKLTGSSLNDIADIDLATLPPTNGQTLKWNSGTGKWTPSDDLTSGGVGSISNSELANGAVTYTKMTLSDGDIPQAKVNGLIAALAGKEPTLMAGTSAQYYRGDKSWQTLSTTVVPEGVNLYFTNSRTLVVPLNGYSSGPNTSLVATDTILGAFAKVQGQLDAKSNTSSYIDWSTSGVQTIDPSRLNLGAGSAGKALVTDTSGFIVGGTTTSAELSYVSGVTSGIQAQLNSKQVTIDKTTVQAVSKLRIYGSNATNYVELSAATLTANRILSFPDSNGTSGNILATDGSGNLSWMTPSGTSLTDATVTYAKLNLADGDIPQAKVNGLVTALAGKEPAITAGTTAQYLRGNKTLSTFASDVLSTVLTGFSTATNAVIVATDSVLAAFGKLQAQITGQGTTLATKADQTNLTQTISAATVTGLAAPIAGADATNKTYVDAQIAGAGNQWTASSGNVYRSSGNVGIGTTSPNSTLQVNGTITGKASVSNATSTIDFSTGNQQYTTSNCGAFNLNNLKDGGSYAFAIQGSTSALCSFNAYSDAGVTALTVHMPTNHGLTTASTHTLYNYMVMGTHVYVSWVPGY